jgi:hypothetical protein
MCEEMREQFGEDELRQMLNRLTRLHSVTEQSSLVVRVEETIAQIERIMDKGRRAAGTSKRK